jgi:UDP-N-acetylmuramoyl-L-alanyl-D-glutamate--2,6-diaminopimelate ligase
MATLAELLACYPYEGLQGSLDQHIAGVSADSRKVEAGWAFVAIRGLKVDGHQFIAQALLQGASAVVVEHGLEVTLPPDVAGVRVDDSRRALAQMAAAFYSHPSRHLCLIGVTGTSGKTTATYLLEAMLRADGITPGVIGTVTYRYAGREQPADQTTPAAEDLQRLLRQMVDGGVSHCVMEVSSHALAQDRVWGCPFAAALFTNLSHDHLDFHLDMASYYTAKARLFTEYQPGLAVINRDDPASEKLLSETRAPVITYGFSAAADVSVDHVAMDARGIALHAKVPGQLVELRSRLIGRHNVYNILGALATASGLGMDLGRAIQGIESLAAVPGRFERVDVGQPFGVLVDYAHKPDALRNVLIAARGIATGRLIVVFGAGGDRDRGKRPHMGQLVAEYADVAVITSDNPRSEAPMDIIREVEAGYTAAGGAAAYRAVEDRRRAIYEAIALARAGDTVVIAGKGHETYQIIGTQRFPFDDRQVARQALQALGFRRSPPNADRPGASEAQVYPVS